MNHCLEKFILSNYHLIKIASDWKGYIHDPQHKISPERAKNIFKIMLVKDPHLKQENVSLENFHQTNNGWSIRGDDQKQKMTDELAEHIQKNINTKQPRFIAPPAMVKQVNDWVKKTLDEDKLYRWQEYLEEEQQEAESNKQKMNGEHDQERYKLRYESNLKEIEKFNKLINDVNDKYPNIKLKPKKLDKATTKIKVNFDGWKLKKIIDNADQQAKDRLEEFNTIKVNLRKTNKKLNSEGSWKSYDQIMNLYADSKNIDHVIQHELEHWTQDYLSHIFGMKEKTRYVNQPGMPKTKHRTPEIGQNGLRFFDKLRFDKYRNKEKNQDNSLDALKQWNKNKSQELKQMDITNLHDLDDVEFIPVINDFIRGYDNIESQIPDKKQRLEFIKWMVGLQEKNETIRTQAQKLGISDKNIFRTLKKYAPEKWKQAVKELIKGIF